MSRLSDFVVDLNDIYGRVVPGIILIPSLYFILIRLMHSGQATKLNQGIQAVYHHSLLAFCVAFLLLAFLVGEIPLFLIFRWFKFTFARRPIDVLQEQDPTSDNRFTGFFTATFSKHALERKQSSFFSYCTDYLLDHSPQSFALRKAAEANANVRGGVVLPLLTGAIALLLYGYGLFAILSIMIAAIFFWDFAGTLRIEEGLTVRLYYHAWNRTGYLSHRSPTKKDPKGH